jgi:glycosyltransferase involved in cell wall biosynthesis
MQVILSVAGPVLQSTCSPARVTDYAVVLPAFNEEATIAGIADRALAQAGTVIVVDDGSTDGTAAALADRPVILLRNERNAGKGHSLWRGMQHARSLGVAGIITLDADGQHAPEDIPQLIAVAREHPRDIVIGARLLAQESAPRSRLIANRCADWGITRAAGQPIADSQSGFRVYPSWLFDRLDVRHDRSRGFVFESETLIRAARLGARVHHVPVMTRFPAGARASHFRVRDVTRICLMVAWYLVH